jgi:hypothetical protein
MLLLISPTGCRLRRGSQQVAGIDKIAQSPGPGRRRLVTGVTRGTLLYRLAAARLC